MESETASGTNREWVRKEGHMACVWRLAERVARLAAIDQMRVDIFVAKGHPDACVVNENSLSSGSDTWPHRMCAAPLPSTSAALWRAATGHWCTQFASSGMYIACTPHTRSRTSGCSLCCMLCCT